MPMASFATSAYYSPPIISLRGPHLHGRSSPSSVSASVSSRSPEVPLNLPIREIPGDCGLPFIGPIYDRLSYFYFQGRDEFFRSRVRRHGSTVVRLNMPPGPFLSPGSGVVALLDAVSFPVLFDPAVVDKRDLFTGTLPPCPALTGGARVLSYMDVTDPAHAPLKRVIFHLLSSRRAAVLPEFRRAFGLLFDSLETSIAATGRADFASANDAACFDFLSRALLGRDPRATTLGGDGPATVMKWVLFQIGPLLTLGLPAFIEDPLLHSFRLPPALVRRDYDRLFSFFSAALEGSSVMVEAGKLGVSGEEAVHNILFAVCFNTFGGMKILFPNLLKWVGRGGARLHGRLAAEVRAAVKAAGSRPLHRAVDESMPLVRSAVYEALRVEPPVSMQYGRARRDTVVASHDAAFRVRAGEVMFGYQPMATRDPRVFDRPEEFVADRFVSPEGEALLRHVLWSNGPETAAPTADNKQCAGKDFVVLVARLLLVELFLRYDSFDVEVGESPLGASVKVTSLRRATF